MEFWVERLKHHFVLESTKNTRKWGNANVNLLLSNDVQMNFLTPKSRRMSNADNEASENKSFSFSFTSVRIFLILIFPARISDKNIYYRLRAVALL